MLGKWRNGFFSTTFIGATNVGSIALNFDPEMTTNSPQFQGDQVSDKSYNSFDIRNDEIIEQNLNLEWFEKKRSTKLSRASSFINLNKESGEDSTKEDSIPDDVKSDDLSDGTSPQEKECTIKIFSPDQTEEYSIGRNGVYLSKGQEIGYFNIGSSIMLIFEAPQDATFDVTVGQKVKLGNTIMRV